MPCLYLHGNRATDLPLLVDVDTGFGTALNIARTVRELERSGVAGMHIEDQVMAKRCGHRPGKVRREGKEKRGRKEKRKRTDRLAPLYGCVTKANS